MGLAIAVLEELRRRGCLFLVTTHYPEVKSFAEQTPGVVNARMAFDRESLQPLYRLEMGKAGESCALHIAKRLGFGEEILRRAREVAYEGKLTAAEEPDRMRPRSRGPKLQRQAADRRHQAEFKMGDSVMVYPQKEVGIVYRPEDEEGTLIVQVKGHKRPVSYKRVKLLAPASELYPPDYDFSIIFDSVETRKARHQMSKHHVEGLVIEQKEE